VTNALQQAAVSGGSQVLENALAKLGYDHERGIFRGVGESALYGGVAGGVFGGLSHVAGSYLDPSADRTGEQLVREPDGYQGLERRQTFEAGGDLARAMELARRRLRPQDFQAFRDAAFTNHITGLPNLLAYESAPQRPVQVRTDLDGLGYVNDTYGHEAGDALLRTVAEILKEQGIESYHVSGDEFYHQFGSPEEAHAAMQLVRAILRGRPIEFRDLDGKSRRIKGFEFSYGAGKDGSEAERGLNEDKSDRAARGERATVKGGKPPALQVLD
jgi:GGDEF domain-containing protein